MTASMRELIENHVELTRKLERANEELKRKDQLKNEFINIAAHELRAPMQPILGLAELLRRRISGRTVRGSNSGSAVGGSNSSCTSKDVEHTPIAL